MASNTPRRLGSVIPDRPAPTDRETYKRPAVKARASLYLIGSSLEKLKVSKLPKQHDVLARFISVFRDMQCVKTAASEVADEMIDVWKHHFGLRLTLDKDCENQKITNDAVRFILRKDHIVGKILKLYREWNELQRASLRTDKYE